jgi:hypothetical protein
MTIKKPNLETIKAVRKLLSDPARWYKGNWTNIDDYGDLSDLQERKDDPNCQVCLLGAFYACSDIGDDVEGFYGFDSAANGLLSDCLPDSAKDSLGDKWTPTFNDAASTTHEDVLKVLDCAIAKAEGPIS